MNEKTKSILNAVGLIMIGIGIGVLAVSVFVPSAEQLVTACNNQFGVGNWNLTLINNTWQCTGLDIQYYDVNLP